MKYFCYLFAFCLFFYPLLSYAQEEGTEKLPAIVIRGKDRSYLEIVREKKIPYMSVRGEKKAPEVPYFPVLPARKKFRVRFPVLSISRPEISPILPEREEVYPYPPPVLTLTQMYTREGKIALPAWEKTEPLKFAFEARAEKEFIHPPLQIPSFRKRIFSTPFIPSVTLPSKKVVHITRVRKEVPAYPLPYLTLTQMYTRESEISPWIRGKIPLPRKFLEAKTVIEPPLLAVFPRKTSAQVLFPAVSLPLPQIQALPSRPEIGTHFHPVSPKRKYLPQAPLLALEKKTVSLEISPALAQTEKKIKSAPLEIPSVPRVYYLEQIKKTDYPYLHFLLGIGDHRTFNYELNYGREKEKRRYLLNLERKSFPRWVTYGSVDLSREEDLLQGGISLGEPALNESFFTLQGKRNKLELPPVADRVGERIDSQISLSFGQVGLFNHWNWNIWGEKTNREDTGVVEESWDDLFYGANLAFYSEKFPVTVQGKANWNSLRKGEEALLMRNKYQILIQALSSHPFSLGKNLLLDFALGVKGVKDEKKAQGVGSIKLDWHDKKELFGITFEVEKDFHLPGFSDTYLSQAYSQIDPEIGAVDIINYSLGLHYKNLPQLDLSLIGFFQQGKDVIWVYEDTPYPHLEPSIMKLSRQGWTIKCNWQILPAVTLEPSYTWKTVKSENRSYEAVPHQPKDSANIILKIKGGNWIVETQQEILGKRYFTFSSRDTLPRASRIRLKLTYQQKNWEVFLQMESNNQYFFTQDYEFPEDKLSLGLKLKLF